MAEDFRLGPEMTCSACDRPLNAITQDDAAQTEMPDPGDLTICAYCLSPLIFTEELLLRLPTMTERLEYQEQITVATQHLLDWQKHMQFVKGVMDGDG